MAKNLKNTLLIDNEEYNINAKYSDEAGKVSNYLTVKESGTKAFDFDGSSSGKTIDYVPADKGGTFSNPIYLSNPTERPLENEIITSKQINSRIANLTGSPVFTWNADDSYSIHELFDEDGTMYKLNTIVGTSQDFYTFKKLITTGSKGLKFTIHNVVNNDYTNAWCSVSGVDDNLSVDEIDWDIVIPYTYVYTDNYGYKHKIPVIEIEASAFDAYVYGNLTTSINKNIKSVVIPDSVTTIGETAFRECGNLVSANIPSSVTSIGVGAFVTCSKLQNLTISSTSKNLFENASVFSACTSLNSVVIPEGIEIIGTMTFSGCTNLANIVIPTTTTTIEAKAFNNCTNLSGGTVYYAGSESEWEAITIEESTSTNASILAASRVNYENTPIAGNVDVVDVVKDPFIYVCRDVASGIGAQDTSSANDVYIKLPNDDSILKISRGATRLDSVNNTADEQRYYSYETLAAIIAGINARLDGLGGETLRLPTKTATGSIIIQEGLHNEILSDTFTSDTAEAIPTVQQLEEALSKIQGKENKSIADIINGIESGDSLLELREDINELQGEIGYYDPEDDLYIANSRIDELEDKSEYNKERIVELEDSTEAHSKKIADHSKRIAELEDANNKYTVTTLDELKELTSKDDSGSYKLLYPGLTFAIILADKDEPLEYGDQKMSTGIYQVGIDGSLNRQIQIGNKVLTETQVDNLTKLLNSIDFS